MLLSAFHKLPELLLSDHSSFQYYEAHLANIYAMAILLELNSQNIGFPISRFTLEKKYENSQKRKADLYVNLLSEPSSSALEYYGIKAHNWIEIKYFSSLARDKDRRGKASNVGRILNDIVRLCIFIREEQGKHRSNGRYLLLLFNEVPKKYLAFERKGDNENRIWLESMLKAGNHTIQLDTGNEVKSVKNKILKGIGDFSLKFKCEVHTFNPLRENSINTVFYGYFIYIYHFEFRYGNFVINYDAFSKRGWDQKRVENLDKLAKLLDKNMPEERGS